MSPSVCYNTRTRTLTLNVFVYICKTIHFSLIYLLFFFYSITLNVISLFVYRARQHLYVDFYIYRKYILSCCLLFSELNEPLVRSEHWFRIHCSLVHTHSRTNNEWKIIAVCNRKKGKTTKYACVKFWCDELFLGLCNWGKSNFVFPFSIIK